MNNIPKLNLFGHVEASKIDSGFNIPTPNLNKVDEVQPESFKNVFSSLVNDVNHQMEKPDALLSDLMSGKPNVDVHDVMTAIAKAELGLTISTSITTKVIQSYEKIMQIQV